MKNADQRDCLEKLTMKSPGGAQSTPIRVDWLVFERSYHE